MQPVLTERVAQPSQSLASARLDCQAANSTSTLIFANSLESGRMLFAELFPVKSKKALEWHAVLLGRVSFKKTSHKPVEPVLPVGSSLCSFKKTCNTFMAGFVE